MSAFDALASEARTRVLLGTLAILVVSLVLGLVVARGMSRPIVAGKGFAVVASEVKALATQTAKATEEISEQISAIQHETQQSVGEIKEICGLITQVNGISASVASAVEEQGAATSEIARNVQAACAGLREYRSSHRGDRPDRQRRSQRPHLGRSIDVTGRSLADRGRAVPRECQGGLEFAAGRASTTRTRTWALRPSASTTAIRAKPSPSGCQAIVGTPLVH